jgi:hypothetical protein
VLAHRTPASTRWSPILSTSPSQCNWQFAQSRKPPKCSRCSGRQAPVGKTGTSEPGKYAILAKITLPDAEGEEFEP